MSKKKQKWDEDDLTIQEHNFCGSTHPELTGKNPYIPLAILRRERTIQEVAQRRENGSLGRGFGNIFKTKEIPDLTNYLAILSLEPLDPTTGQTMRDPQPLGFQERSTRKVSDSPKILEGVQIREKHKHLLYLREQGELEKEVSSFLEREG